jgi:predicted site-specific integrase-resolvase
VVLLETQGRAIEVINLAENDKENVLADLTSAIYSFCVQFYRQRRANHKTKTIVKELQANGEDK